MRKSIFLIVGIIIPTIFLNAQQNIEEVFKNNWKVGLNTQFSYFFPENSNNPLNYNLDGLEVFDIGILWNIKQHRNSNYQIGISIPLKSNGKVSYEKSISDGGGEKIYTNNTNFLQTRFFAQYEYYINLSPKTFIYVGGGPEVKYFFKDPEDDGYWQIPYSENSPDFYELNYLSEKFKVGLNAEIGVLTSSTTLGVFNLFVKGHMSFNKYLETTIKPTLESSESWEQYYAGHYVGVGIKLYPKKIKKE